MTTVTMIKPVVRPPYLFGGFLVAGLILHVLESRTLFTHSISTPIIGILFVITGIALIISAVRTLNKKQVSPRFKPVGTIVTNGPFAHTRNPMYLAFTLIYSGIALAINTLWPFVLLPLLLCVMHYGVIQREERYLEEIFGEKYSNYRRKVPRWL